MAAPRGEATFIGQQWLADAAEQFGEFWNYEITSVDDRPITVRKFVSAIVLLIIGLWASRRLSRMIGRRLLPRVGMNERAAVILESIVYYLLVAVFTLLALHMAAVPLGALAFLGGAVAIGVGFGSQNVVNNFISGLILLIERPVRVGDVIQLDNVQGTVEAIGGRSTRVRTGANAEAIIPNSTLLQNNVVNWTLSDDRIRTLVTVGVAYGSPTADVARLLAQAAGEHENVLGEPAPAVFFTNFGDSALEFEVQFWIRMRSLADRRRIESDVRHRIDQLFREANVMMAFPQRDVHLDAPRPITVRVVSESDAA